MSPLSLSQERHERTIAWLRASLALAALLPLVLLLAIGILRYSQVRQDRQDDTGRLTRIISEHTLKLFDANNVLLGRMREMVAGQSDAAIRDNEAVLHGRLIQMVSDLPQVQSVWISDAAGNVLLSNRFSRVPGDLNVSDRESFQYHKGGGEDLYITGVLLGKKTNEPFFDLTRARHSGDGTFAGTLQVSLHPNYLTDFYQEVAGNDPTLTLTLLRQDGSVIARWPGMQRLGGKLAATSPMLQRMLDGVHEGDVSQRSSIDGVMRIGSFRKLPGYPVYAFAGYSQASIVNAWASEMVLLGLFAIPFSLMLGGAGLYVTRQTRRELRTAGLLKDEIEQRKKMEDALHQSQKLEALRHLTGGVAHDFNNLLMVVELNSVLLSRSFPSGEEKERIESIQRAVAGGVKLTRQLLGFSRRQPLMPVLIDLRVTLEQVMALCNPVLGSNISFQLQIAADIPAVKLDVGELELAFLNLAINAKHAMPNGGRFEVSARAVSEGGAEKWVEVRVCDTGCGIPPGLLERVFEPFFSTKGLEGTGLGLSQVYGMCARSGGGVTIESTLDQGTCVILRLPGYQAAQVHVTPGASTQSADLRLKVLVVEDNDDIARASLAALSTFGCQSDHRRDSYSALEYLENNHQDVDLVLSDIVMPGEMDGIELMRFIQSHYPGVSIALMTGYSERLPAAEQLGIPILSKPFGLEALGNLLAQVALAREALADASRATG
jgi:two-component system, NtrC family, sensor kinase